ncbi:MAG: hypothetical protein HY236_09545 [Acidobacteria bacterium]|nr:hypothetical protein [Acidobacteriota bacterium]
MDSIELRIEPGHERIRPYETAVIQLRAYGHVNNRRARLPEIGATFHLEQKDSGWISRPFRYAGPDEEPFSSQGKRPSPGRLAGVPAADSLPRDAFLYTAPGKTGKYTIEARTRDNRARVQIEVTPAAPSHRVAETTSFGPESQARDFYRDLAEHYAPLICQETWFDPKADFLARFDYDGDWRGDNNWDHLYQGSSQAYVYYAAMETPTHYFLVYNFFHPRSYSDRCGTPRACRENDNQGLILTIHKDGSKYGRLQVVETLADNNIYSYTADPQIREGAHRIDGQLKLWRDSSPIVFVQSGQHSVHGAAHPDHSRFSVERMDFTASTGVTYRYAGAAARPAHANDRGVSYELLPIAEHWWPRATTSVGLDSGAFDDYFRYAPFGHRPHAAADEIAGAFQGRKFGADPGRPFWSWHDTLTLTRRLLAIGQLGMDPAYAVFVNLRFPSGAPFSLSYTYNPYLEASGRRDAVTAVSRARSAEPEVGAATPVAQGDRPAPPRAERQLLSPPAEKPHYKLKEKHGQLEFHARVDGVAFLFIRGDQIEVEYAGGRPMDEIRYRFSQPLPAEELDEVKLEDVDGRGSVRLLEWPNSGNQYQAKIRIQDLKPGAAPYRFKLVWKR